jgi:hypothetical protein
MIRRLFLVFTLAFLFAFGQQGAAVHALSHLADEQGQTQGSSSPDNKATHAAFCDKCVTYASLGSAVGISHVVFAVTSDQQAVSAEDHIGHATDTTRHYAARAPPALA